MNRYRIILFLVALPLFLFCAGCVQEQGTPNVTVSTPVPTHETMLQVLDRVTGETQAALDLLNSTVSDAAIKLGKTGISGPEADAVLVKLPTDNPAIINVITYDPNGTVLAAEPASAHMLIGRSISGYEIVRKTLTIREPAMTEVIPLAEGGNGSVLAYPVFSADGNFTGVVSIAFSPYKLIAPVTEKAMEQAPFTFTVAQTGGLLLYHADSELVGKQTFNESVFAGFPEILDLARQYSGNQTGYGTFPFYSIQTGQIVQKETWWDTVRLHGTEWRVLVIGEK
jgi:polar amino acid transport system substrate-binding protein